MSLPLDGAAPARRAVSTPFLLALLGIPLALAIGLAAGVPTPDYVLPGLVSLWVLAIVVTAHWPWATMQVLFFTSIFLICYLVTETRAANPIDVFLIPVLIVSVLGGARAAARREAAGRAGAEHAAIAASTRRMIRATFVFYTIAFLSLVAMALRGHPDWALDSLLTLLRAFQGLSFFALGLWWFRTGKHLRVALRTIEIAAWSMVAVNVYYFAAGRISRAGQAWIVNFPDWPMTSPNDSGLTILFVWAWVRSLPERERTVERWLLQAALLVLLVMTGSRSGLLAWTIYNALTVRWFSGRTLLGLAGIVGAALLFAPENYWARLGHTLNIGGGSFDAYTSLIRVYSWQAAWKMFLDHPIFGVGYLGFHNLSSGYNSLGIVLGPVESYYLEMAVSMGVIGVAALAWAFTALVRLGLDVRRASPLGSYGHTMGRHHVAVICALFVVILTGDNLVGMTALSQLAIWCAYVVRAGHLSIDEAKA